MTIRNKRFRPFVLAALLVGLGVGLSACGSAYSGLTDASGLGAGEYQPAVYIEPGNEERYKQVLAICRQVAANRQATAAQRAQLETLTGSAEAAAEGASQGAVLGSLLESGGWDASWEEGATIGAGAGLLTGLVGALAGGAEGTADETRRALLNCLTVASRDGKLWQVVE